MRKQGLEYESMRVETWNIIFLQWSISSHMAKNNLLNRSFLFCIILAFYYILESLWDVFLLSWIEEVMSFFLYLNLHIHTFFFSFFYFWKTFLTLYPFMFLPSLILEFFISRFILIVFASNILATYFLWTKVDFTISMYLAWVPLCGTFGLFVLLFYFLSGVVSHFMSKTSWHRGKSLARTLGFVNISDLPLPT